MSTQWYLHPVGCLCPECTEIRRAVGRMRNLDKHVAEVMNAGEPEIRKQAEAVDRARKAADARKLAVLGIAAFGADPYRTGGGAEEFEDALARAGEQAGDCTCPGNRHGDPRWAVHLIHCPMRVRLCTQGKITAGSGKQMRGPKHDANHAEPALTPEQKIRRELAAFDDWMQADWDLPDWLQPDATVQEPGKCASCHLGWAVKGGSLCAYCHAWNQVIQDNHEHRKLTASRGTPSWVVCALLWTALAFISCVLTLGAITLAGAL